MAYKVHLVEDDINLNRLLRAYLEKENWQVDSFLTGEEALESQASRPDIWILDIMLPDMDGYQLIKEIKAQDPEAAVIFISARDQEIDRVIGLEFGCEDYLAKPFLPRELVIRVRNILNRRQGPRKKLKEFLSFQSYKIDLASRRAYKDEQTIDLSTREYNLLVYFLDNLNIALTREQILVHIWGEDYFGSDRVVDDLLRRLRNKMPDLNIETIYGFGYRLAQDEA